MNKDAIANLLNRKSCRQFTEEQIDSEKLDIVLKCGTHAPTGRNAQSALIVAVQDKETRDRLSRLNAMGGDNDPFYGAPTVVIVLGLKNGCTPFEDGCLIMGNMLNAARAFNVMQGYPNLWVLPGIAIALFVLGVNFFGDGLRDVFDVSEE